MSEEEAAATDDICASCGQAEIDDIKLKDCDGGCDLVKYCRDECQESHREQHEGECIKRFGELRDRDLFTQPDENYLGECPICCLPLPLDPKKSTLMSCCSQIICNGCCYANQKREIKEGLQQRCAFCREPLPKSDEENNKRLMKRIKENNDPAAMCHMGKQHRDKGDLKAAFDYFSKAAELGDTAAHYNLSIMYHKGQGVEKSKEKEMYHLEQAAIGGHPTARHNLGVEELENGRYERAVNHFIIIANLGDDVSLKAVKSLYAGGHASKEDYAAALRGYQAAVEATKSAERKKAGEAIKNAN